MEFGFSTGGGDEYTAKHKMLAGDAKKSIMMCYTDLVVGLLEDMH